MLACHTAADYSTAVEPRTEIHSVLSIVNMALPFASLAGLEKGKS